MLKELTGLIEKQCRLAAQFGIFGTQEFHIEFVERLEDKDGAFNFLVTTWNDVSENPREKKEMSLFELMDLLGRVIGHRATNDAVDLIKDSLE
jgi:hypothetical protein